MSSVLGSSAESGHCEAGIRRNSNEARRQAAGRVAGEIACPVSLRSIWGIGGLPLSARLRTPKQLARVARAPPRRGV
jgi:hypothetical protein